MKEFKNKTAFITGGASGLGLAIAKACAREGMNVVIADLRQSVLDDAEAEFNKNNWPVLALKLDVSDYGAYEIAVAKAEEKFGMVHLLINNAGICCAFGPIDEVSFKEINLGISINLMGPINGIKLMLPKMLNSGEECHIVSTASMSALLTSAKTDIYNITKSGVLAAMESLAETYMDSNVGFSVFCPGPHNTSLGSTSSEVTDTLLGNERPVVEETDNNTLPEYDTSLTRSPEEAGRRVIRGIKRKDLYILTHSEFKKGLTERFEAIYRALPDEVPNEKFYTEFAFIAGHPVFNKQEQVPALEK